MKKFVTVVWQVLTCGQNGGDARPHPGQAYTLTRPSATLTRSHPLARPDGPSTGRIPSAASQAAEVSHPMGEGQEGGIVPHFLEDAGDGMSRTVNRQTSDEPWSSPLLGERARVRADVPASHPFIFKPGMPLATTVSILGASLILSCVSVCQASLIFSDSFNYTASSNLGGQGGWVNGNTGDEVGVVSGNLSVSGLAAPSGNMISLGGDGMDPYQAYTSRSATTYYSVAFTITSLGSLNTSGGYVLGLASGTSYAGVMWLKSDGADGFYIGISKRTASGDVAWSSSSYSVNSTIFVVGDYVFNAGSGDDVANLWINPNSSTFAAGTEPSANLTTTTTGTDSSSLTRFYFRQDSTTTTPDTINFDEVRVGTTWADVTPVPEPAGWGALSALGLMGICGLREWRQRRCGEKLKSCPVK